METTHLEGNLKQKKTPKNWKDWCIKGNGMLSHELDNNMAVLQLAVKKEGRHLTNWDQDTLMERFLFAKFMYSVPSSLQRFLSADCLYTQVNQRQLTL